MNPNELMEKVAEVAPEKYAFFVKAASEIKKGPFADEVREELDGIMKKAQGALGAFGAKAGQFGLGAAKFMGGVGAAAGTAALGGIAMALAGDAYGAAKRGLTKSRNYQAMLDANPDLREAPADRVQRAFSTLHRLNPEFSGDPTVAGSYVRSQSQYEHMQWDPGQMKTLVDSHKSLQDVNKLPTVPNFSPEMQQLQMEKLRGDIGGPNVHQTTLWKAQHQGQKLKNVQMVQEMKDKGFDPDKVNEILARLNNL